MISCSCHIMSSSSTLTASTSRCVLLWSCANLKCQEDVRIRLYIENEIHIVPIPTVCNPANDRCFNLNIYDGTAKKKIAYMFRKNLRSFCPNNVPSPAHMSPLTSMNNPTPGMAPLTLCNTIGSVVKYLLISGIHDTKVTKVSPNPTPTFRKLLIVLRSALARS